MKNSSIKKLPIIIATLLCLSVICAPVSLLAAGADISLGAGAALVPDYEGSDDSEGVPALFFSAKWDEGYFVRFAGNSLRANALPNKTWSLGPVLQYRGSRDDDVDNNQVSRMRKVDSAVEGGVFVGYNDSAWDASLQWVTDLSDSHDGSLVKLMAGYSFKGAGMMTRIGISSTYADDDYMDTYFSVDANNSARSGLPVYKADGGIKDVGIDATVNYSINDNWGLMGLLGYTELLDDAEDSPVVDRAGDSSQVILGLLAVYKF